MDNHNNVVAVVVTYNRLEMLKDCINGLRNQTVPLDIVVVNNGSTDGTESWLMGQPDLIVINQGNYGGAGGFYTGTKYSFENGYEWLLMMDDDGIPDKDQLKYLLEGAKQNDALFVNALVSDIEDKEKLAFGVDYDFKIIYNVSEAQNLGDIPNSITPFNGTLIHRSVIEKVGFIKKEMFIWGDENEYKCRIAKAGYKYYTITKALHYHPKSRNIYCRVFPKTERFLVQVPLKDRAHIVFRNLGYNRRYGRVRGTLWLMLLYSLYYIIRFNVLGLFRFYKYFISGIMDIYPEVNVAVKSIKPKES